jgi:hypothetical protein
LLFSPGKRTLEIGNNKNGLIGQNFIDLTEISRLNYFHKAVPFKVGQQDSIACPATM